MNGPRTASLFSGHGGLDLAVTALLGGQVVWHVEKNEDASTILEHHWPQVPNHGDITTVDWATVEPVDVICGGFPCQDLSYAGRGAGITEGTRSGLWAHVADAVGVLRPRLLLLENVAAIVTRRPGLDIVVADLAALGFAAEWTCLRASDVGACHGRDRWFLAAYPEDDGLEWLRGAWDGRPGPENSGIPGIGWGDAAAENTDGVPRIEPRVAAPREAESGRPRADPGGRDRAPAAHPDGSGSQGCEPAAGHDMPARRAPADTTRVRGADQPVSGARGVVGAEPRAGHGDRAGHPPAGVGLVGRGAAVVAAEPAPDTDGDGCRRVEERHGDPRIERAGREHGDDVDGRSVAVGGLDWGKYEAAIRRHERVFGQPAPIPTERGNNGQPRLAAPFPEWMMGIPPGHVTGLIGRKRAGRPTISRAAAMTAIGNGVVPRQAYVAYGGLIERILSEVPAEARCAG